MADGLSIQVSAPGADELADKLEAFGDALQPKLRSALAYNATLVRDEWRESLGGTSHAKLSPSSITYDTRPRANGDVAVEIGAVKYAGRQGGVALLREYGVSSQHTAREEFGLHALQNNVDDLVQGINIAIGDTIRQVGL